MKGYMEILNKYKVLNETAEKNVAVFFGADWMSEIPVAELARDNGIDAAVYNRSLKVLKLKDTESVIEQCVCELKPGKVFINIGENDIASESFDEGEFAERYEWLLYSLHSRCNCEIYILSVTNDKTGKINGLLKGIAEKYGCEYIDISACRTCVLKFFTKIRFFLRNHPITFYEAMKI